MQIYPVREKTPPVALVVFWVAENIELPQIKQFAKASFQLFPVNKPSGQQTDRPVIWRARYPFPLKPSQSFHLSAPGELKHKEIKSLHTATTEEAIKELWQITGGLTLTTPVTLCPHLNKKGSCKASMDVNKSLTIRTGILHSESPLKSPGGKWTVHLKGKLRI